MATTRATRAPWHLWLLGIAGIAWYGIAGSDYVLAKLGGAQYLRDFGLTEPQISYTLGLPAYMTAVWAVGVWGGLLGAVLLLLRNRLAAPVFAVSLIAYLFSLLHLFVLTDGGRVMGGMVPAQWAVLVGGILFAAYSAAMVRQGLLR